MRERIKLPYDALISLLQGKEIHLMNKDNEIIIAPPFDGMFLTHEQIRQLQYSSEMGVWNVFQKLFESSQENYEVDSETLSE